MFTIEKRGTLMRLFKCLGVFVLLMVMSGCSESERINDSHYGVLTINFMDKKIEKYYSIGFIYFNGRHDLLYKFKFKDLNTKNITQLNIKLSQVVSMNIRYYDSEQKQVKQEKLK